MTGGLAENTLHNIEVEVYVEYDRSCLYATAQASPEPFSEPIDDAILLNSYANLRKGFDPRLLLILLRMAQDQHGFPPKSVSAWVEEALRTAPDNSEPFFVLSVTFEELRHSVESSEFPLGELNLATGLLWTTLEFISENLSADRVRLLVRAVQTLDRTSIREAGAQ